MIGMVNVECVAMAASNLSCVFLVVLCFVLFPFFLLIKKTISDHWGSFSFRQAAVLY
jgi:hypothetical protein